MLTKICNKCNEEKSLTEFNKEPMHHDGLKNHCKACRKLFYPTKSLNTRKIRIKIDNRRKNKSNSYHDNLCCVCTDERLSTSRYCVRCLIAQTVRGYLLEPNESILLVDQLIAKFYKNKASCFYTDLPLVLGLNASIDHRIPKSKGGKNTIDNLEWVHVSINTLKNNRTEKEFISAYGSMLVEYNLLASKGIL